MQGMVSGQMYPQVYMVADGPASAGPVATGSQPELYTRMMRTQQQPGFQAFTNYVPQAMITPVPLSPERPAPARVGPVSPATAVFNSPSNENFRRGGGGADGPSWNHGGITWWSEMTYNDKQWLESQYGSAQPTGYHGIKQDGNVLLCQEESGAIHILDHQMWTVQAALNFFTSQMQTQRGAGGAPDATGRQNTYADVIQRSRDAQAGGQPQPYQADHAPAPGDSIKKKDKKEKKDKKKA